MSSCLVLFSFAVLVCKVHSQPCSSPILPPACPAACVPISCPPAIPPCPVKSPQVINPNPYVTTIIDNSVSNALVNALQLLIVSNLIEATIGPTTPVLNNLGPLLDSLVCSNPCPVEVFVPECLTYASNYDLISPYGPTSTCAPYYDVISSYSPITTCGPYYDVIPPCGPITTCGPSYELSSYVPINDPYLSPLCGLSDVYPNYFTYTETITPICIDSLPYNGYGEVLFPLPGIETIFPNTRGGLMEIIPTYINYPIPEICPSLNPYYGGIAETAASTVTGFPNTFGCLNEVVAPCLSPVVTYAPELPLGSSAIVPNCYGGLTELPSPCATEVTIPAPLTSNYGYSPSSLPCVRVNTEPLVYDNCVFNGYSGPVYF